MRILALWLYMKKTSLKILVASYDTTTEQPRTLLCRHGAWVPRDPNTQRGICSAGPIPLPGPGPGPVRAPAPPLPGPQSTADYSACVLFTQRRGCPPRSSESPPVTLSTVTQRESPLL
jgi:hypothetical protein